MPAGVSWVTKCLVEKFLGENSECGLEETGKTPLYQLHPNVY